MVAFPTVAQLIPNFYDNLLSVIFKTCGLGDLNHSENQRRFLQNLRLVMGDLRTSYNKSEVTVRYSDQKTQLAYLLAYFPVYIETTFKVLHDFHQQLQRSLHNKDKISVALIGAGPCPEIIAILLYVHHYAHNINSIKFYICDIDQNWKFSQDIVNQLSQQYGFQDKSKFSTESIDFDVRYPGDWKRIQNKDLDLLISQNLINEFVKLGSSMEEPARNFIDGIIGTAINTEVFIIDLANYSVISDFKDKAHQILREQGIECIRRRNEIRSSLNSKIPTILDHGNFFGGEGFRARQNIKFSVLYFSLQTAGPVSPVQESIDRLIRVLQDEVAAMKNRVAQISGGQVSLSQELKAIQQTYGDTADKLKTSNTQIQNLASQYIALQQELKALQSKEYAALTDVVGRIGLLESLRGEIQGDLLAFKSVLSETKHNLQQYETQVKLLEELYQDLDLAVQERILPDHAAMLDLCSDLESRSKQLETQVSDLRSLTSALADESKGFSGNLELSKREIREYLDVKIQQANTQSQKLADRLVKIEQTVVALKQEISQATSQQSRDAQIKQQHVDSLTEQVQLLQRDLTEAQKGLELQLQDIQEDNNTNVRNVNVRFKKFEGSLTEVEQAVAGLRQEISQLQLESLEIIGGSVVPQPTTEMQLTQQQQQVEVLTKRIRMLKRELTSTQEGLQLQLKHFKSQMRTRSILFAFGILLALVLSIFI